MTAEAPTILLTIDVEDWFHSSNLEHAIPRSGWDGLERRVAAPTRQIMDLFDEHGLKGTFFVLGWSAERDPGLIREIHERGHEVACHGYGHDVLHRLTVPAFREDIRRARGILEDATGAAVRGYRAPSFSITEPALDVLAEEGFLYDSSYFPIVHDKYGVVAADPAAVSEVRSGLKEVPVPCLEAGSVRLPWGGGAYFRLLPYAVFAAGVRRILAERSWMVFYLHPWELDPDQPRPAGLRLASSLRHRTNLRSTRSKLERFTRYAASCCTSTTVMEFVSGSTFRQGDRS